MGWNSSSLRIRLTKNEILRFAKEYLSLPSYEAGVSNGEADERLERVLGAARRRRYMTCDDLLRVAKWKYRGKRLQNLIAENTRGEVKECTEASFAATTDRLRIGALLSLSGISWSMASVILHFAFPNKYPVLDERVKQTINGPPEYNFDRWMQITKFCRTKSDEFGVTMRELDRALWTSDENSKEKK